MKTSTLTVIAQDPSVKKNGRLLRATFTMPWEELELGPKDRPHTCYRYKPGALLWAAAINGFLQVSLNRFKNYIEQNSTVNRDHIIREGAVAANHLLTHVNSVSPVPAGFPYPTAGVGQGRFMHRY